MTAADVDASPSFKLTARVGQRYEKGLHRGFVAYSTVPVLYYNKLFPDSIWVDGWKLTTTVKSFPNEPRPNHSRTKSVKLREIV